MNELLMQAIVEMLAFLILSPDEIVDPDAAISQVEDVASILKKLSAQEREEFRRYIERMHKEERARGAGEERVDFFRDLYDNLGLGSS